MFLDLLEAGFRQGHRPETTLAEAAQTNDRSLGQRFQKLAARLRQGDRLSQALDEVPNLLPPQVAATLRVGEEVGDVRKVLPACRGLLRDTESQTRIGFNYLVISSLVIMPVMPILVFFLNLWIFPKMIELMNGAGLNPGHAAPAIMLLVIRAGFWVAWAQLLLAFCLWWWVLSYVRGPRACGAVSVCETKTSNTPLWK